MYTSWLRMLTIHIFAMMLREIKGSSRQFEARNTFFGYDDIAFIGSFNPACSPSSSSCLAKTGHMFLIGRLIHSCFIPKDLWIFLGLPKKHRDVPFPPLDSRRGIPTANHC